METKRISWKEYMTSQVSQKIDGIRICSEITPREAKGVYQTLSVLQLEAEDKEDKSFEEVVDFFLRSHVLTLISGRLTGSYPYISLHISEVKMILEDIYTFFGLDPSEYSDIAKAYKRSHYSTWSDYKLAAEEFANSLMKLFTR